MDGQENGRQPPVIAGWLEGDPLHATVEVWRTVSGATIATVGTLSSRGVKPVTDSSDGTNGEALQGRESDADVGENRAHSGAEGDRGRGSKHFL